MSRCRSHTTEVRIAGRGSRSVARRAVHMILLATATLATVGFGTACSRSTDASHQHAHGDEAEVASHGHHHEPPHGGTAVVLGHEAFHLELVKEPGQPVLRAYLLDGHMEHFVRSEVPEFTVIARTGGDERPLIFRAVTDPHTGERPGDSSTFEAEADWLATVDRFDARLEGLVIRGAIFTDVPFRFPEGNEK